MSNVLYPTARVAFLQGEIDWRDAGITAVALSDTYVYSSSHQYYSDLSGVLDSVILTGNTVLSDGVADAQDAVFTSIGVGEEIAAIVVYLNTGTPTTSPLIYFADTNDDGTSIARTGDGTPVTVNWSSSDSRVFKI